VDRNDPRDLFRFDKTDVTAAFDMRHFYFREIQLAREMRSYSKAELGAISFGWLGRQLVCRACRLRCWVNYHWACGSNADEEQDIQLRLRRQWHR